MAAGLTLDAGALIAAEKGERAVWAYFKEAIARGAPVTIPAPALAQAWRGNSPRVARLRRSRDLVGQLQLMDRLGSHRVRRRGHGRRARPDDHCRSNDLEARPRRLRNDPVGRWPAPQKGVPFVERRRVVLDHEADLEQGDRRQVLAVLPKGARSARRHAPAFLLDATPGNSKRAATITVISRRSSKPSSRRLATTDTLPG